MFIQDSKDREMTMNKYIGRIFGFILLIPFVFTFGYAWYQQIIQMKNNDWLYIGQFIIMIIIIAAGMIGLELIFKGKP
jgi:hypothetical protein